MKLLWFLFSWSTLVFLDGKCRATAFFKITTKDIVTQRGYPLETHHVTTEDGYILTLYRIPKSNSADEDRKAPVLLMHGLLGSSDNFVTTTRPLGYYLSDRGYDIWLGNCRGNRYSRRHVRLDPDRDDEFWNFSWHEIGIHDLPAMIDYVLMKTNHSQLFYMGHSQGTTSFFVMASVKPSFNDKIKMMAALAPSVFQSHIPQIYLQLAKQLVPDVFRSVLKGIKVMEYIPNNELVSYATKLICGEVREMKEICSNVVFLVAGYDSEQFNRSEMSLLLSTFPAGASTKQFLHYGQLILSGKFRQYDYGVSENTKRYNSPKPPDYNLKDVKAPVAIFYASNDWMVSTEDVDILCEKLPNVILKYLVPYEQFNHMDFAIAIDAHKLVYDKVFEEMQKIENIL